MKRSRRDALKQQAFLDRIDTWLVTVDGEGSEMTAFERREVQLEWASRYSRNTPNIASVGMGMFGLTVALAALLQPNPRFTTLDMAVMTSLCVAMMFMAYWLLRMSYGTKMSGSAAADCAVGVRSRRLARAEITLASDVKPTREDLRRLVRRR